MVSLLESLSNNERKVLTALKPKADLNTLLKTTKLKEVEVVRALQWLSNKGLIRVKKTTAKLIEL
ncbi:hypothetical protein DRJ48_00865, partial [Candidatus Woesearchaeota archaeon]